MKASRTRRRRRISASRAIVVVVFGLALLAVLVPLPMHRPLWVEIETVLAAWWLVWTVVLAGMLYAGLGLRNDFSSFNSRRMSNEDRPPWLALGNFDFPGIDLSGADDPGALVTVIATIVLLGLFILAGWILLEVVFPLVIPLAYGLMLVLLTRVVHRQRNCRGKLPRAIAVGAGWASLYTLPLVLGVAVLHWLV